MEKNIKNGKSAIAESAQNENETYELVYLETMVFDRKNVICYQ